MYKNKKGMGKFSSIGNKSKYFRQVLAPVMEKYVSTVTILYTLETASGREDIKTDNLYYISLQHNQMLVLVDTLRQTICVIHCYCKI